MTFLPAVKFEQVSRGAGRASGEFRVGARDGNTAKLGNSIVPITIIIPYTTQFIIPGHLITHILSLPEKHQ